MNNQELVAKEILVLVGGSKNIRAVEHCATRLRLSLVDEQIAIDNGKSIDQIDGVKGHFNSLGQFQIILGTGFVNQVYTQFVAIAELNGGDVKAEVYKDLNLFQKLSRILGDIFIPIIPAIVAAGMFMGIANTLQFIGFLDADSNLALFISILTDTAFIFLPALICWSATKKFGGNPVLGIVLGLMLTSPVLPNAWAAAGGFGDVQPIIFNFNIIKIPVVGMQGQVLTPLALGFLLSRLERIIRRYTPEALDIIVVPTLSLVISLGLGLFIIGPILFQVEHSFTTLVYELMKLPFGIGQATLAFFNPIIVMTGLHHAFGPLELVMISEYGTTPLNPALSCSNVAMAGAAFGCALRIRDTKFKSLGYSAALTATFGITEPALFGVILRTPRVLLMGMFGAALGGFITGVANLGAVGTGVTGIPGILLYIGTGQTLIYLLAISVSFISAMLLTMKFGQFDKQL